MSLYQLATTVAIIAGAFVGGFALVPVIIYFGRDDTPRLLRRILSRVSFVEGQFAFGSGGVLTYLPGGQYRMLRLREDDDGHYVEYGGERYDVDRDDGTWSRLGLRPFAVGALVTKDSLRGLLVDERRELSDGGVRIVTRDTMKGAIPQRDGLQVSLGKFYDRIGGAGGTDVPQRAKEHELEEHGGDEQLNQALFIGAVILCLALGAFTGVFVL